MTSPFDFDLIQAAHPLAEFCESRGIELRKRGFVRQGLCPLHEEDSASFTVYPDNHYYCFGCGRHGDVVDLLAALDQLSIKDAAHKLSASSSGPESASRQSKQPVKPYELTNEDIERMASAAHRLAAISRRDEFANAAIRSCCAGNVSAGATDRRHGLKRTLHTALRQQADDSHRCGAHGACDGTVQGQSSPHR